MHLSSEVSHRAFQLLDAFQDHEPSAAMPGHERYRGRDQPGFCPQSHIQVPRAALPFPTLRNCRLFRSRGFPKTRGNLRVSGAVALCGIAIPGGQDRLATEPGSQGTTGARHTPRARSLTWHRGGWRGSGGPAAQLSPRFAEGLGSPAVPKQRGLLRAPGCCKSLG